MAGKFVQKFTALSAVKGLLHGFVLRNPLTAVDSADRDLVLGRLKPHFRRSLTQEGVDFDQLALSEQVHGAEVDLVKVAGGKVAAGADGLVTGGVGIDLGIYVADCCAVYLVDPVRKACALVHSGRKGSEGGIAGVAIRNMTENFGTQPADLVVVLSPCIRPPNYEVDIPTMIRRTCLDAGVTPERFVDEGWDTSRDLKKYYSYRMEKGHTGRLLAFVGWRNESDDKSPEGAVPSLLDR